MNLSQSEENIGNQKTEKSPSLLQTLRELLSNGKPKTIEPTLTDFQIQRRQEAIKAVEKMSKHPLTAEELKCKIATLKENAERINNAEKKK